MIAPPGEEYQRERWFVGTLSEACDIARERTRTLGRKQKVSLLRYPFGFNNDKAWKIVDQYGLQVMY